MGSNHDFDDRSNHRSAPIWDRPVTRRDLLRYGGLLGFGAVGAGMLASCTPLADGTYVESSAPPDVPPAQAKYLVIVVVDGCRADYLDPSLHLPTLTAMAQSGTKYMSAWSGMMESITPACHAALGTGRFAKNNGGILGFYWENPTTGAYGEAANLTNNRFPGQIGNNIAVDPTSLEQILQANNVPTMATYLKEADPTAKVYAGAGAKFYAVDAAGGPDADFITYIWNDGPEYYRGVNIGGPNHTPIPQDILDSVGRDDYTWANYGERYSAGPMTGRLVLGNNGKPVYPPRPGESDTMVIELAKKVIARERPRIVILNLGDQDFPYGHQNGGILSPEYWKPVMKNVDAGLGSLMDTYRDLGIFDETAFVFLGDHGMVPIEQQVDKATVLASVSSSGATIAGADFHTGGFIWLTNPLKAYKAADFIDDAIEARHLPGVLAVYFRGEAGGHVNYFPSPYTARTLPPSTDRAYRYLLETLNGTNAPHVALVFQEWTGITGAGSSAGSPSGHWYGDHGGASWSSHWIPLIMSGPGIRKGYVSSFPARLVDLAPTGLRLLGVPYPELDGVALADAFERPFKSEVAAQRVFSSQLTPVVSAMKQQADRDIGFIRAYGASDPIPGAPGRPQSGVGGGTY